MFIKTQFGIYYNSQVLTNIAEFTEASAWLCKVYHDVIGLIFSVTVKTMHLMIFNDIFHFLSHSASVCKSFCNILTSS